MNRLEKMADEHELKEDIGDDGYSPRQIRAAYLKGIEAFREMVIAFIEERGGELCVKDIDDIKQLGLEEEVKDGE